MAAYILLPALTHRAPTLENGSDAALSGQTAVHFYQNAHWLTSTLQAALAAQPRSAVLLHPADAPLAVLTLPPLPAARRDAALRVVLEERVLGEVQTLVLAVQPLGQQRFAVAYCERAVLGAVQQVLGDLGASGVTLSAMAAHLPADCKPVVDGWAFWADGQGAGALPTGEDDVASDLSDFALVTSGLKFNANQQSGSAWARWRWAAYAALVCLMVGLVGQFAYWRSLVAADAQAQSRINAAFKKALPTTPQVDAIKQLQRAASGGGDSTALAAALAKLPPEVTPAAVQSFEWRAGALTVTLSGKTLAYSEAQKTAFAQRLQTAGVTVRWGD